MRSATVYLNALAAATLTQQDDGTFELLYHNSFLAHPEAKAISLTLPLSPAPYRSEVLFPYFFNLLPEGSNKLTLCRLHRISPDDYFSILLQVASTDTVGAVRVVRDKSLEP